MKGLIFFLSQNICFAENAELTEIVQEEGFSNTKIIALIIIIFGLSLFAKTIQLIIKMNK